MTKDPKDSSAGEVQKQEEKPGVWTFLIEEDEHEVLAAQGEDMDFDSPRGPQTIDQQISALDLRIRTLLQQVVSTTVEAETESIGRDSSIRDDTRRSMNRTATNARRR